MEQVIATDIQTIVDFISTVGFVGLLIILAIPNLRKRFGFGNGNDFQETINTEVKNTLEAHQRHLKIANEEMGDIRDSMKSLEKDVSGIKTDIRWIKEIYVNSNK